MHGQQHVKNSKIVSKQMSRLVCGVQYFLEILGILFLNRFYRTNVVTLWIFLKIGVRIEFSKF